MACFLPENGWGGGQSYATEAPLTEAEHEVQPEGSEIPDENVDAEGGIVDGADVDVDKETEDVDAAEVGEEEENQTKSGKRMVAFSDDGIDSQADDTGAFNVTGGTYGVDYEYKTVSYHTQGYGNAEGWSGPYVPNKSFGVYKLTQNYLFFNKYKHLHHLQSVPVELLTQVFILNQVYRRT